MNSIYLLKDYRFVEIENEFKRDNWTVRLEHPYFEIFSDPEIDTRYYYGYLDMLEKYLSALFKK